MRGYVLIRFATDLLIKMIVHKFRLVADREINQKIPAENLRIVHAAAARKSYTDSN